MQANSFSGCAVTYENIYLLGHFGGFSPSLYTKSRQTRVVDSFLEFSLKWYLSRRYRAPSRLPPHSFHYLRTLFVVGCWDEHVLRSWHYLRLFLFSADKTRSKSEKLTRCVFEYTIGLFHLSFTTYLYLGISILSSVLH